MQNLAKVSKYYNTSSSELVPAYSLEFPKFGAKKDFLSDSLVELEKCERSRHVSCDSRPAALSYS